MDIVTNEGVTALARRLGNKRGWKQKMPAMPPGMPGGGVWSQQRMGNRVRLCYQVAPGQRQHVIGEWTEDEAALPAPSSNGAAPKKGERPAPPPAAPEREPVASEEMEPLILLTPAGGGAWRLNGYGVARAELIRALRLSLVHLVARQSGVAIIDEVVAPEMAVVTTARLPRLPQPRSDKAPGKRPAAGGRVKRTKSYPLTWDELDDEEDGSDQGELLRQDAW